MSEILFEEAPGSLTRVTVGGTRNEVKFSRPWQTCLPLTPDARCPFCTLPQNELGIGNNILGDAWRLLENLYTPHKAHRLIIPRTCPTQEYLQNIGGKGGIREALDVARRTIGNHEGELALFVHVGFLAGQNLGHMHWHLMQVSVLRPMSFRPPSEARLIFSDTLLQIFAAGTRPGQCMIVDRGERQNIHSDTTLDALAHTVHWIVHRGAEKFVSSQGFVPEFSVSIRINAEGYLRYATYCPILTIPGAPEQVFAPLEGAPYTLPWTHDASAHLLRG